MAWARLRKADHSMPCSARHWQGSRSNGRIRAFSLSNAERAEDQVKDVVGGGGSGDGVEWPQGVVEIKQQHFVGDSGRDGAGRGSERGQRLLHQALMADVGEKASFGLRSGLAANMAQNFGAQFGNAFP